MEEKIRYSHRSMRLKNFDYSQENLYFVTICTNKKQNFFGKIENFEMKLNALGRIVNEQWENIINRYDNILLEAYVVMPNHLHGILHLDADSDVSGARTRAATRAAPTTEDDILLQKPTLCSIVGSFKSLCVHDWINYIKTNNLKWNRKLWQRNFYDHIIRNDRAYEKIAKYVINNAQMWDTDCFNKK